MHTVALFRVLDEAVNHQLVKVLPVLRLIN